MHIYCYTSRRRNEAFNKLKSIISHCGGWILKAIEFSTLAVELSIKIPAKLSEALLAGIIEEDFRGLEISDAEVGVDGEILVQMHVSFLSNE